MQLGKWHPFKELAIVVWRKFACIHLASSFFALFPTTMFYTKPKLTAILTMYTYHFKAYPTFKVQLEDAVQQAYITNKDQYETLCNVQDFYEVYLPTVC